MSRIYNDYIESFRDPKGLSAHPGLSPTPTGARQQPSLRMDFAGIGVNFDF